MNISEEYIFKNKKLIILISGLSGTNRSKLAREIARDFKLKIIELDDYCKSDYNEFVSITDDIKIKDWDNVNAYDWDKFNDDMKNQTECVTFGNNFPDFKINFKPDFHIHIKLAKENLIEKRKEYIKKHDDECKELLEYVDNEIFDTIINKSVYKYYIEYREKSTINKYLNADKNTLDEMYEQVFEYIIHNMRTFLNKYYEEHKNEIKSKNNVETATMTNSDTESNSSKKTEYSYIDTTNSELDDIYDNETPDDIIFEGD
ncbi:hypothetical protein BMW23_0269 [Bodo saltans virus]|uniref:Uncharacterized protein n=1 Tax=Bodo saltans virus TaxID=2024608 RepID=A0A2H4UU02_9VIRU|nr:hypothetical protein QJ851_gp0264 [Bodo saltans virus]ATZ80327.1 hypothetical protein BMW23_0269 [Bodo saltans virus]